MVPFPNHKDTHWGGNGVEALSGHGVVREGEGFAHKLAWL